MFNGSKPSAVSGMFVVSANHSGLIAHYVLQDEEARTCIMLVRNIDEMLITNKFEVDSQGASRDHCQEGAVWIYTSQATRLGLIQMSSKGKGTTVHNHVTTNIQNRRHAKKKKKSHYFIINRYDTSGSFVSKIQM